jgi:integrase
MPRHRGNGSGSVYRSKDPRRKRPWVAVVTTGWTPQGRPIRVARYALSWKAADRLRSKMADALRDGGRLPDDKVTVSAYLVDWFNARTDLRPQSQRTYAHAIRHLATALGRARLVSVRPSTVDAALASMPAGTAKLARSVLSAAYRDAERDGLVTRNPVNLSRPVRAAPREQRVPTLDEARRLLAVEASPRDAALVTLGMTTGLRVGELCGLRWEDIDGASLTVRRQIVAGVEGEPKTPASRRTIDLPPVTVAALRRWRLVQARPVGRCFDVAPRAVSGILDGLCDAAGIDRFPPHSMRRFVGQVLSSDPKAAEMTLGHSSARISLDVYARGTDEGRRRAAEMVGEALG